MAGYRASICALALTLSTLSWPAGASQLDASRVQALQSYGETVARAQFVTQMVGIPLGLAGFMVGFWGSPLVVPMAIGGGLMLAGAGVLGYEHHQVAKAEASVGAMSQADQLVAGIYRTYYGMVAPPLKVTENGDGTETVTLGPDQGGGSRSWSVDANGNVTALPSVTAGTSGGGSNVGRGGDTTASRPAAPGTSAGSPSAGVTR